MTFDEYAERAAKHAVYPRLPAAIVSREGSLVSAMPLYPAMKISVEANELLGKLARGMRDGTPPKIEDVVAELGDVLWYLNAAATDLGVTLGDVAKANIVKLDDRAARGALRGEGDHR